MVAGGVVDRVARREPRGGGVLPELRGVQAAEAVAPVGGSRGAVSAATRDVEGAPAGLATSLRQRQLTSLESKVKSVPLGVRGDELAAALDAVLELVRVVAALELDAKRLQRRLVRRDVARRVRARRVVASVVHHGASAR